MSFTDTYYMADCCNGPLQDNQTRWFAKLLPGTGTGSSNASAEAELKHTDKPECDRMESCCVHCFLSRSE